MKRIIKMLVFIGLALAFLFILFSVIIAGVVGFQSPSPIWFNEFAIIYFTVIGFICFVVPLMIFLYKVLFDDDYY